MREWEKRYPGRVESIFRSLQERAGRRICSTAACFDFKAVAATGNASPDGDKAFDPEG